MLSYSEIEKGDNIILNNNPYKVIEARSMFKGRSHSVLNTKLRNLKTEKVISKTFHPSDEVEEADIEKMKVKFIYSHRNEYSFCEKGNPSNRFSLNEKQIGEKTKFLKPKQIVKALFLGDGLINIELPIKVQLKVKMAPPSLERESQSTEKVVTLETGAEVTVPDFVETGDIIEINTETEEYSRRVE